MSMTGNFEHHRVRTYKLECANISGEQKVFLSKLTEPTAEVIFSPEFKDFHRPQSLSHFKPCSFRIWFKMFRPEQKQNMLQKNEMCETKCLSYAKENEETKFAKTYWHYKAKCIGNYSKRIWIQKHTILLVVNFGIVA